MRFNQRIHIGDILRQRNIEHRASRPAQAETGELGIPHDADDAKRAGILRQIQAEVLPQGIFVAAEESLGERFVDDRDGRGGFVVATVKIPSADQFHTEVLQVLSAHPVPGGARGLVQLRCGMAGDEDEFAPIVGERVVQRQTRSGHAGKTIESVFNIPVKRRQLRLAVSRRRVIEGHGHTSFDGVPEMLMLQLVETSRQHGGACDQHHRERRLHDQQRLPGRRGMIARAPAGSAQGFERARAGGEPGRSRAKNDARRQRDRKGKCQYSGRRQGADGNEAYPPKCQRQQQAPGRNGDTESGNASAGRKQDRLNQGLPDNLPPAGSNRHAKSGLAAACHRARQQQVRDIGTSDQQHHAANPEQDL